jgi:hypothetical protein
MEQIVARMPNLLNYQQFDYRFRTNRDLYKTSIPQRWTNFDDTYAVRIGHVIDLEAPPTDDKGITFATVYWEYDPNGFADAQVSDVDVGYFCEDESL